MHFQPHSLSKFLFSFKKRLSFYFYHLRNFLSLHFLFIFSLPAIFFLPLTTFSPLVGCPLSSYMIPLSISQFSSLFLPVLSFIFPTNPLLLTISLNRSLSPNPPPDQPPLNLFGFLSPSTSFPSPSYLSLLKSSVTFINPCTFSSAPSHLHFLCLNPGFSPASPLLFFQ